MHTGIIRLLSRIVISIASAAALAVAVYYFVSDGRILEEPVSAGRETFTEAPSLPDEHGIAGEEDITPSGVHEARSEIKPVMEKKVSVEQTETAGPEPENNALLSDSAEAAEQAPADGGAGVDSRFIIYVSAMKNKAYAVSMINKVKRFYPNAFTISENNYRIVMIPDIESREEAGLIVKDLIVKFDVEPLVYVQQRKLPDRE